MKHGDGVFVSFFQFLFKLLKNLEMKLTDLIQN